MRFDVLNRSQTIHRSCLLEASAGTGKTYSIENIFVRLLLEEPAAPMEKILVVTFTRAAARELKMRVRKNIETTLHALRHASTCSPDYISRILEEGDDATKTAAKRLERALCSFDTAQIFTIHAFCSQMLGENVFEGDTTFDAEPLEEAACEAHIRACVRDFFRTGITNDAYSPAQIEAVGGGSKTKCDKLEKDLFHAVKRGLDIAAPPPFSELIISFQQCMQRLKRECGITHEVLVACAKSNVGRKRPKPEEWKYLEWFCSLFGKECWTPHDLESLIENSFAPLKKFLQDETRENKLLDPLGMVVESLQPFVDERLVFARMARDCRVLFQKMQEKEERLNYDDILKAMDRALDNSEFLKRVRGKYSAACIDEFQDTDPLQWRIFSRLFLDPSASGVLYLVGDPKQSIYAFRRADIYTYLQAGSKIAPEGHASLDTNYRSHPPLVDALNYLFCEKSAPGLFRLPKRGGAMVYPPVKASEQIPTKAFNDALGAVHFFLATDEKSSARTSDIPLESFEKKFFLPFIAREIVRLVQKDGIPLRNIAILVADRYQEKRVAEFLSRCKIPTVTQRGVPLTDTPAWNALRDLFEAVHNPKHESAVKKALGGKILRWTHTEIAALDDMASLEKVIFKFYALKNALEEGIIPFYRALMAFDSYDRGVTVMEMLLQQDDHAVFYHDLQNLFQLLFCIRHSRSNTAEAYLNALDDDDIKALATEEPGRRLADPNRSAVQLMTLHTSKGLEFDVVFTLGLVKRTKVEERLVAKQEGEVQILVAATEQEKKARHEHCLEQDAEKMRQLYVAMTRARYRVYNPVALVPHLGAPEFGKASPMELFLACLGWEESDTEGLYERIDGYDGTALGRFVEAAKGMANITYSYLESGGDVGGSLEMEHVTLAPPRAFSASYEEKYVYSFSSLASKAPADAHGAQAPHDFAVEEKNAFTLPAGNETGTLLHACMEKIPFETVRAMEHPKELSPYVLPLVVDTPYEAWSAVLLAMLFRALRTPLLPNFCLADLDAESYSRESEFLFPCDGNPLYHSLSETWNLERAKAPGFNDRKRANIRNMDPFAIIESRELSRSSKSKFQTGCGIKGYMKGFVDLIFTHQGKYYLLDWKSNWLGPGLEDYCAERLKTSMKENDYFLQASLYQEALKRYLALVDKRPFTEIYGGAFYVYLRGLEENKGVYRT